MDFTKLSTQFQATVLEIKGECTARHKPGDKFIINCYDSGGLCGFFYHSIFPNLQTLQFGGKMPWWQSDVLEFECPDHHNLLKIKLERKEN